MAAHPGNMPFANIAESLSRRAEPSANRPLPAFLSEEVPMKSSRKVVVATALIVALISLLVYLRALDCGFVNWDDQIYILNNVDIRGLDRKFFVWAFTDTATGWWMPLTWLSFAVDYHFWGLDPFGYHLTNILLHAVNGGLVVLLADRLLAGAAGSGEQGPAPARWRYPALLLLAGLVWGLHPLRVESVAWATERKDVLNGAFALGAAIFYLHYAQLVDVPGRRRTAVHAYLASLVLFGCSLMAKPVSVVIPILFLVADWAPLGRLRRGGVLALVREKVPYFALAAAMATLTLAVAEQDNVLLNLTLGQRIAVSGNAVFEYCRLTLWPVGIIPLYFIPDPIPVAYTVKTVIVAGAACCCVYAGIKRPWLLATGLCFVIPLLPVMAFTQNGIQAFAARFTYLPAVVPSIVAAAGMGKVYAWGAGRTKRLPVAGLAVALLFFYGAMTVRLIDVWHDSGTMWSRVIAFQPFDRAYFYRALFRVDNGDYSAAVDDYTACLEIALREGLPEAFNLYAFRGEAFLRWGKYDEAVRDFSAAIASAAQPLYYYNRGVALRKLGRLAEAAADFRRAGKAKGQIEWFDRESGGQNKPVGAGN